LRKLAIVLTLLAGLSLPGCIAGPHQLRRSVDDWDHKMYVESPWIDALLWVVPVIPLMHFGAGLADFFVVDAYSFWFKDAWDGKGTGFRHYEVKPTDGAMNSLLMDDGSFLEIK
jgi:hypothetical protein